MRRRTRMPRVGRIVWRGLRVVLLACAAAGPLPPPPELPRPQTIELRAEQGVRGEDS